MTLVSKAFATFINMALSFLPNSPFRGFIDNITNIPYINFFNYFVPVSDFVAILTSWTAAIALFYVVSAILRTIKAIN